MRGLVQRMLMCLGFTPCWEFDHFRSRAQAAMNAMQEGSDCLNDRMHDLEARVSEFDVKGATK